MEKMNYYVRGSKPPIFKELLEEIQRMPPTVRSNLVDNRRIAASKGCSQCTLMKYAQLSQSMNTKTGKKGLPTFMLRDTSDAHSTIIPKEQGPESHLHSMNTS